MLLTSEFVTARFQALREKAPYLDIVTELAPGPNEEIDVVFAFKLPDGLASRLPNLKMASSVGAGADGLLQAKDLPRSVRVTRAADPGLGFSMAQIVTAHILQHFRSLPMMAAQQRAGQWKRLLLPEADCAHKEPMKQTHQPGAWPSPLSANLLAQAGSSLMRSQPMGDDLWWEEVRPSVGGLKRWVNR